MEWFERKRLVWTLAILTGWYHCATAWSIHYHFLFKWCDWCLVFVWSALLDSRCFDVLFLEKSYNRCFNWSIDFDHEISTTYPETSSSEKNHRWSPFTEYPVNRSRSRNWSKSPWYSPTSGCHWNHPWCCDHTGSTSDQLAQQHMDPHGVCSGSSIHLSQFFASRSSERRRCCHIET